MKIAICDDDKRLRRQLRHFLETNLALMGIPSDIIEYESGSALLSLTPQNAPDMLFLDIEMPGTGGMDTARALRRAGHRMLLIFVTAYPDYVFEGYEVQAFHYILKPYQESRLKEVLEKAIAELSSRTEQYYAVDTKSGTLRIDLRQTCYFKSDRRKIYAVDRTGAETVFYRRLDEVEQEVPGFFKRVHNRYLVNLNYISRLGPANCMCGQQEIPVSRTYKQGLAVAYAQMLLK